MGDLIEFYCEDSLVASVDSSMAINIGQMISIKKVTYKVKYVSFSLDHVDEVHEKRLRCNVELEKIK